MKSYFVFFVGLLLLSATAWADTADELSILQEFFSPAGMENRSTKLTGAAVAQFSRKPMVGEYLPKEATIDFRLLVENETSAVYVATVRRDGIAESWSAFFQRGRLGSKLEVIKALNIPPYLADVEYKSLVNQKGRSSGEEVRLAQLQRLFMTTAAFKEYFNENRATYDTIARFIESGQSDAAQTAANAAALVGVRRYAGLKSEGEMVIVTGAVAGKDPDQILPFGSEVRVSAFLDSVLGLLHLPPGLSPPPMSAKDYIFIEALADNWYLFRNLAAEPLSEKLEN